VGGDGGVRVALSCGCAPAPPLLTDAVFSLAGAGANEGKLVELRLL
jgi:hypothetical protein